MVLGTLGVGAGVMAVLAGAALPWVTILDSQRAVNGVQGDGAYLTTAAVGAAGLWAAYVRAGRPAPLRALTALAGFLVTYWAFFDAWRIADVVGRGDVVTPLGSPVAGPGPIVAGIGGVLVVGSALGVPAQTRALGRQAWLRLGMSAALLATGAIHLREAPHHLDVSLVLGLGFIAAAVSQLGLGAIVPLWEGRLLLLIIIADCAFFFVAYVYAVFHGLPFPAHGDAGLRLGAGEAVTLPGVLSKAGEAIAIELALLRLASRRLALQRGLR